MAYDGSIVYGARVDNSEAEKQLKMFAKRVAGIEKTIASRTEKRDYFSDRVRKYAEDIRIAQEQLKEMQSSGVAPNAISAQEEKLKSLNNAWKAASTAVESYNTKIKRAQDFLDLTKFQAGGAVRGLVNVRPESMGYSQEGLDFIENYSKPLEENEEKIREVAQATKQLTEETKQLHQEESKMDAARRKAATSLENFGKRLKNTILSAAVFSVMYKGVRGFISYISKGLMANEQFAASLASLKGALASAFQPIFTAIAPAIQTLINYLSTAMSYIGAFLSMLFGTTLADSKKNAAALNEQKKALGGVGGAAAEASKQLAAFDEVNKLETPSSGGTGSDGGATGGAEIDFGITDMDKQAQEWAERFKATFGPYLDDIAQFIATALTTLLATKLTHSLGAGLIIGGITLAIGNISSILSGKYSNTAFQSGLKTVISGAMTAAGLGVLTGSLSAFAVSLPITIVLTGLITTTITNWPKVKQQVSGFWDAISGFFTGDMESAAAGWDSAFLGYLETDSWTNKLVKWIVGEDTWKNATDYLKNGGRFVDVIKAIQDSMGITDLNNWLEEHIAKPFSDIWDKVKGFFSGAWDSIKSVWNSASTWFDTNVIQPIVNVFSPIWEWISGVFTTAWQTVKGVWSVVSTWFKENVTDPVNNWFKTAASDIGGFFSGLWTDIKGIWTSVSTWFREKVTDPVNHWFEQAISDIGGFFSGLWEDISNGVKAPFNTVLSAVESAVNWIIGLINGLTSKINSVTESIGKVAGISINPIAAIGPISIPRLAQGAVIPANREFLAVLGDQKSGTNIETPLATMVEAFNIALRQNGGGNAQVIENVLILDGEVIYRNQKKVSKRHGNSLVHA